MKTIMSKNKKSELDQMITGSINTLKKYLKTRNDSSADRVICINAIGLIRQCRFLLSNS